MRMNSGNPLPTNPRHRGLYRRYWTDAEGRPDVLPQLQAQSAESHPCKLALTHRVMVHREITHATWVARARGERAAAVPTL